MSRRCKHRWQIILTFPCTEKEARVATTDGPGPSVNLTADRVDLSAVVCGVCQEIYTEESRRTFCSGSPPTSII